MPQRPHEQTALQVSAAASSSVARQRRSNRTESQTDSSKSVISGTISKAIVTQFDERERRMHEPLGSAGS